MNNMRRSAAVLAAGALALLAWVARGQVQKTSSRLAPSANDQMISNYAQQMLTQGKEIFRYDTFGDEAFWETLCISTRQLPVRNRAVSVQE